MNRKFRRGREDGRTQGGNAMKRSFVLVSSILALALALAVPAMAQTEQSASGTVVSSNATQLVIRTDDGRQMTFAVDADTNGASGLQVGSPISVRYHDMNGTMHAASVSSNVGSTTPSGTTANTATDTTGNTASTTGTTGNTGSTPTGTSATGATAADRTRPQPDATGNQADMPSSATSTSTTRTPATTTTRTTPRDTSATTAPPSTTGAMAADTGTTRTADTGTTRMPATASPLPLIGLSGLLSLAGGLGARVLRRRA
jgi:hypothetical protein